MCSMPSNRSLHSIERMRRGISRIKADLRQKHSPKPVHRTTAIEIVLFAIIGVLVVGGAIALYQQYSPRHARLPNTIDDGLSHDRINILIIGVAGDRRINGGNDLADAIMVLSLKPSTKQAALISVPRDLYVKIGRFGLHRLNAAHDLGYRMGYRGGGPGLLIDTLSPILGEPIHAYARIDFAAFEKLIDDLGGVDIYVYRPFHDFLFKDGFEQGWQHMNGHRALQYARYRYVRGAEGNNFARELRQQQVVSALKKKAAHLSMGQALNLLASATHVSRYTATNLSTGDLVTLYRLFHSMPAANIRHVSLAPFTEIFMVSVKGDEGEAVRPRGGTFAPVQQMAQTVFDDNKPVVNRDQIQLSDAEPPHPADVAGDDSLPLPSPAAKTETR